MSRSSTPIKFEGCLKNSHRKNIKHFRKNCSLVFWCEDHVLNISIWNERETKNLCIICSQGLRQSSDAHSRALAHAVSEQKTEKPGEQAQLRLAVFGSLEDPGWFGDPLGLVDC